MFRSSSIIWGKELISSRPTVPSLAACDPSLKGPSLPYTPWAVLAVALPGPCHSGSGKSNSASAGGAIRDAIRTQGREIQDPVADLQQLRQERVLGPLLQEPRQASAHSSDGRLQVGPGGGGNREQGGVQRRVRAAAPSVERSRRWLARRAVMALGREASGGGRRESVRTQHV